MEDVRDVGRRIGCEVPELSISRLSSAGKGESSAFEIFKLSGLFTDLLTAILHTRSEYLREETKRFGALAFQLALL
jgi:hypothetical protein